MANATDTLKIDSVAVFFEKANLEAAVGQLKEIGIADEQMGLLCSESCLSSKLEHLHAQLKQQSGNPDAPNVKSIDGEALNVAPYATFGAFTFVGGVLGGGALVASAGVLGGAVAVAAAASTVVGGIGALTAGILSQSDAENLQEQLDAGHMLLFVRTGEDRQKDQVLEILAEHSGIKPRVLTPEPMEA